MTINDNSREPTPSPGSSMNYYDAVEDQWRQLWVAGGYSIDYTGGLDESGSMVLSGKINYYNTGKTRPFAALGHRMQMVACPVF